MSGFAFIRSIWNNFTVIVDISIKGFVECTNILFLTLGKKQKSDSG